MQKVSDFIPDPTNYTMKANKPSAAPTAQVSPINEDVLALLEDMSKEQLIALIRRVGTAMFGVAMLNKEQTREAMKLRMATIALTSYDNRSVLQACNDWLDREEGKAVQRVVQDTNVNVNMKANMELLERMQARLSGRTPVVIENTVDDVRES